MSHKQDRARAEAGQVVRSGEVIKNVATKVMECAYPPCKSTFRVPADSPAAQGKAPAFCQKHGEELRFLLWALPKIEKRPVKKEGLTLPGDPEFKVVLKGRG